MSTPEPFSYEAVPSSAVRLFRMVWQLETWLRTMLYVELRALRPDWEAPITKHHKKWPPDSLAHDKDLHYMATPHQAGLSYLTFGGLWKVMSDPDVWSVFSPYFPPSDVTAIRVREVKAIRNRVAHFREPHPQDVNRLTLFMQEMEPGVRRFCERYCCEKVATDPAHDPVCELLAQNWDQIGYGIELLRPNNGWLYAPPPCRNRPRINARVQLLTHKNYALGSLVGVIYKLSLFSRNDGPFDIVNLVEVTKQMHKDIIHIQLSSSATEFAVTIPAVQGVAETAELLQQFLSAGLNNSNHYTVRDLTRAKQRWPEYVLWPNHLLTFFDADMPDGLLETE